MLRGERPRSVGPNMQAQITRNEQDREGQEKLTPALRHGRPDRSAVIHLLVSNLNGQEMQRNTRGGNGETCQRFLEGRHQQDKKNRPSGIPRSLLGRSQPRSGHVIEGHGDHKTHEHAKSDGKPTLGRPPNTPTAATPAPFHTNPAPPPATLVSSHSPADPELGHPTAPAADVMEEGDL